MRPPDLQEAPTEPVEFVTVWRAGPFAFAEPVRYELEHVDVDRHVPFPLTVERNIRPAPIVELNNVQTATHAHTEEGDPVVFVVNDPHAVRVIFPGDW